MSIQNVTNPNVKSWLNGFFNNLTVAGTISGPTTDYALNAGVVTGFDPIVDNGNGTVNVPGGDVYIRSTNTDTASINLYTVTAVAPLALTDLQNNFVCVDYNAGSPIIINTVSSGTVNENDRILLFVIYRSGTELTITKRHQKATNNDKYIQQFFEEEYINRRTDGLVLGETGVRNVTVTIGTIWTKLNKLVTTNFDTFTGSTFNRYFLVGATYTRQTGQTLWDNANWNNTATGLVPLTASYYSFQDFYVLMNDTVVSMYATAEYPALSVAEHAPIIPIVPELVEHSVYIGRIVIQQGATTASAILSPFGSDIDPVSSVGDHTHLINLAVDSHLQYTTLANRGGETLNIDNITLANTFEGSVNDKLINAGCAGYVSGFGITDNLDGTVDIASGTGYIRTTNSDTADMEYFSISGVSALALTDNSENYIYVLYGSPPTINVTTSGSTIRNNENDRFELYEVYRQGTTLHITNHFQKAVNNDKFLQQRLYEQSPGGLARTAGLIISDTGTRNVAMTAGTIWLKLNKISISAIDTSGADTFDRYYYNFTGATWVTQSSQTQWDNAQYNDVTAGTGLVAMTPNRWSYQEFFIEQDGQLKSVYGDAQYLTQVLAESASVQTFVPDIISEHALYIGRIVFQNGAGTGTAINPFDTQLSFAGVTDHGSLTGLGDDDHAQYALLAGRSGGQVMYGGLSGTDNLELNAGTAELINRVIIKPELRVESNTGYGVMGTNRTNVPAYTNEHNWQDSGVPVWRLRMLGGSTDLYLTDGSALQSWIRFKQGAPYNVSLPQLTANTPVYTDASKDVKSITVGTSLDFSSPPTLNTIQDIRTTADNQFNTTTLSTHLVSPIVYGSVASGANLTIDSTSHGTKGLIYMPSVLQVDEIQDYSGGNLKLNDMQVKNGDIDCNSIQLLATGARTIAGNGHVLNFNSSNLVATPTNGNSFNILNAGGDGHFYLDRTSKTVDFCRMYLADTGVAKWSLGQPVNLNQFDIYNHTLASNAIVIDHSNNKTTFVTAVPECSIAPSAGNDLCNKTYVDSVATIWQRVGTVISPSTAGDDISTTGDLIATELQLNGKVASSLMRTDASKQLDEVTIGNSISWNGTTIDTIQDLRTTASPTFVSPTVTNIFFGSQRIEMNDGSNNIKIHPSGTGTSGLFVAPNGSADGVLWVDRSASSDYSTIKFSTAGVANMELYQATGATNDFRVYDNNSASDRLQITNTGVFKVPVAYTTPITGGLKAKIDTDGTLGYDASLLAHKMNVANIEDSSWIYNLQPVQYNRRVRTMEPYTVETTNKDGETVTATRYNEVFTDTPVPWIEEYFIADDVEVVHQNACAYDDEQNKTGLKGIRENAIIAGLVGVVKAQKTTIDTQATTITNLQTQIDTLNTTLTALTTRVSTLEGYHA